MAMITSVRAPLPVAEVPRQPHPAEAQVLPGAKPGAGIPVAAPLHADGVHKFLEKSRSEDLPFHVAQVSAVATAAAAKDAYIRARIAAGLNPLPLP